MTLYSYSANGPQGGGGGGGGGGSSDPFGIGFGSDGEPGWERPVVGYIQGATGGPATPLGSVGKTQQQVEYWETVSEIMALIAGLMAATAAGMAVASKTTNSASLALQGSVYALYGALVGLGALLADQIARDPPQHDYARVAEFRWPPDSRAGDVAGGFDRSLVLRLERCNLMLRAKLDSMERSLGAEAAGDTNWATTHALVSQALSAHLRREFAGLATQFERLADMIATAPWDATVLGDVSVLELASSRLPTLNDLTRLRCLARVRRAGADGKALSMVLRDMARQLLHASTVQ